MLEKSDYDYQVIFIDPNARIEELPEDTIFPALADEDNILQGSGAIMKRIQEVEAFKVEANPIRHGQ